MKPQRGSDLDRREFLHRAGWVASGAAAAGWGTLASAASRERCRPEDSKAVAVVSVSEDPVASAAAVKRALGELAAVLGAKGVPVRTRPRLEDARADELVLLVAGPANQDAVAMLTRAGGSVPNVPEALALARPQFLPRPVVLAVGSDVRGLVYALLELTDRASHASHPLADWALARPVCEQPANAIRSLARAFVSEIEDKDWFYDRLFWERYLAMVIAQRFNRFSLTLGIGYDFATNIRDAYFYFAYPFLLSVPGFDVYVPGLPDAERERNLETLRFISETAAGWGLHFQLGLWTHAYRWTDSPRANYTIAGLTPDNHAAYCREALRLVLERCPAINGVTFRVHGESGVPEGSYDFWRTVFEGLGRAGRRIEIDMHAKGIDQSMIDVALATGMPVKVSPKFWAEHLGLPYQPASIRALEMPPPGANDRGFFAKSSGSRRFLRYSYGDLFRRDRHHAVIFRIWPGTQRLLLWGDPVAAAAYSRAFSFCGSEGVEICEPLFFKGRKGSGLPGGRDAYSDAGLRAAGGSWEKYRYTYRLWGRKLYRPNAEPEVWRRLLRRQFGNGAARVEAALSHASRILPLITTAHTPSAANNNYWPEMYFNMPMADATRPHPYGDSPAPRRFGTVSPLDPELFAGIDEFAADRLAGKSSARYSPLEVADWLQQSARLAREHLARAKAAVPNVESAEFRRLAVDVAIQCGLGDFFAFKFRAGVLYALFARTNAPELLREAIRSYRQARDTWAAFAQVAQGRYAADITFGLEPQLRGHWADRLPAIDADIADLETRLVNAQQRSPVTTTAERRRVRSLLASVRAPKSRPKIDLRHVSPGPFRPGEPVRIQATLEAGARLIPPVNVQLHYRHVNQGEVYRLEPMTEDRGGYQFLVAGQYTDSPYSLQYFFAVSDARGQVALVPGLGPERANQPYYLLHQA